MVVKAAAAAQNVQAAPAPSFVLAAADEAVQLSAGGPRHVAVTGQQRLLVPVCIQGQLLASCAAGPASAAAATPATAASAVKMHPLHMVPSWGQQQQQEQQQQQQWPLKGVDHSVTGEDTHVTEHMCVCNIAAMPALAAGHCILVHMTASCRTVTLNPAAASGYRSSCIDCA